MSYHKVSSSHGWEMLVAAATVIELAFVPRRLTTLRVEHTDTDKRIRVHSQGLPHLAAKLRKASLDPFLVTISCSDLAKMPQTTARAASSSLCEYVNAVREVPASNLL